MQLKYINMRSCFTFIYFAFLSFTISAQVGINTNDPKVTLQIEGANNLGAVSSEDGILVPRVTDLVSNGIENGQLIFLNNDILSSGVNPVITQAKGFYFWNIDKTAWTPIDTNTSEWTYDETNKYTFANRPNTENNDIVITDTGSVYINTNTPNTATQTFGGDKLFVNGSTTVNEGSLRVVRSNINSSTNSFTMTDLSGIEGFGPKFTYRMATQGFASTREMGNITARLVNNDDATRSSKMDFAVYSAEGIPIGFQSGIMINNKGYLALFKINSQDIPNDEATNKVHIKDSSNDPLRIEGLNSSTSTLDQTLVITATGIVKTESSSTSLYSDTVSNNNFIVGLDNHTIRVVDGTSSVRLPIANTTNAGKIFILIGRSTIITPVPLQDGTGAKLLIFNDKTGETVTSIAPSTRYAVQSTGSDYIVIGE